MKPRLTIAGFSSSAEGAPAERASSQPQTGAFTTTGRSASSPLTRLFPTALVEAVSLGAIPVPNGTTNPADGRSAWYQLRRIRIDEDTQQEVTFVGAHATLLPTDNNGAGSTIYGVAAGDALGWGDAQGISAAIIVAKNLRHLTDGQWTHAPANLHGIETGNMHVERPAPYLHVFSFPTGALDDAAPHKSEPRVTFAPYPPKLTLGDTLDIALVVRANQIVNTSGSARYIVGYADIRLLLGQLLDSGNFVS